ncbi:MAG TPA: hypothetical protein VHE81_02515 [Lacipirellulaceae bacterium]|nr:hypothetical protein [Lacipirellulaceae bacterium]
MGIRFSCPNGHKLNVKAFLAGKRGVCPHCGTKFLIPMQTSPPEEEAGPSGAADRSHVMDVASTTPSQFDSLPGSPSIIIAASEPGRPPRSDWDSAAIPTSGPLPPTTPPPNIAAVQPVPNASLLAATGNYAARRDGNRGKQLAISVILLLLVIVLAIVLVLVLRRNNGSATVGSKVAAVSYHGFSDTLTIANDS